RSHYLDYLINKLNESENTTDPSYVVEKPVHFCPAKAVNEFGAKFIPFFYYSIFLLGYFGNGLVLFILFMYEKLQTVTNIFLMNMVISNLLFASALPFLAIYHSSEWIFGGFMCKVVSSAFSVVAAAKSRKKLYAVIASIVVWFISVVASMKEIILHDVWESSFEGLMCKETGYSEEILQRWRLVTYYQQFLVFFLLPLFMVMYCYTSITIRILATRLKEKCRTIKLIFVIIFTFFACWTPFNVVNLLRAIQLSYGDKSTGSCREQDSLNYAYYVTRNLAYLYCGISPVFYSFVGKKFQSHFKRLIGKHVPCVKRSLSLSSYTTKTTSQAATPNSAYE
uniref:Chemokine (C-C motif) receptor 12a n=1 Tax=Neogobius melanostomus TaxID=47308 RepID=A0A8C6SE11_9GOBI